MSASVPIIDIDPLINDCGESQKAAAVASIDGACRDWGFFQVVNHGISDALIDRVWEETHRFFALPRDVKLSVSRTRENPRGYYDRELTKNARDLKEVFDFAALPFFFNPSYDTDYAPLPSVAEDGPKYRTMNWSDFRRARTDGDFADYGKEIQIEDFRIGPP